MEQLTHHHLNTTSHRKRPYRKKKISLNDITLIIFDEVHRTVGNYSYVFIAQTYIQQQKNKLILGMTASPGNDLTKILEVCNHLQIQNIEIRTKYDPDVKPYVHDLKISWKEVKLPDKFSHTVQLLRKSLSDKLKTLKDLEIIDSASLSLINRTKLLDIQQTIQKAIRSELNPPKTLYTAASVQNAALKIYHGIELLQTQGVNAFLNYFQRMGSEALSKTGSKASKNIMKDPNILEALAYAKSIEIEHPKIPEITTIVTKTLRDKPDARIIIFTNYRDTAQYLKTHLQSHKNVRPIRFVGQAGKGDDKGLTQKQQMKIIQDFKQGTYNTLIATSVAEEGLDIPSTDLVVFYEPVPSEIRTIQRRGRTARKMPGKVIILITKGTPDEGYYWSAKRKERVMKNELELLRNNLKKEFEDVNTLYKKQFEKNNQKTLENYNSKNIKIIVDHRESRSSVARYLALKNTLIEPQMLDVGDYVLSSRLGVERKNVDDFLNSLIDGKLFIQMKNLKHAYARPILIVEGEGLLTKRNISHNAIFGCFVSIIVDYGIPIITTHSARETADFLQVMAKREQKDANRSVAIRGDKWSMSLTEHQQFIVESLPNVSSVLAQRLLNHFGSIRAIANASEKDLCSVHGIGKKIAEELIKVLNTEYKE